MQVDQYWRNSFLNVHWMRIYTSMRLVDDLSGISTFYAELLGSKK